MDESTITKMQLHYWQTKQTFLKKIKRKEDDFLVASDAELDAKLELLKSIDETNQNLLNLFESYQERVCSLAQEECMLGRFLRECSKHDVTKAGNLMSGSGKTFLFAGHQFIMLRNILIRSFRDVQTFQYRAVTDTFETVEQMEKSRTAYRAALLWMKDVSKQLDPDAFVQLDKFKKIQNHVRDKKKVFDKLKIDTIQKIDLLSASRCNLFSNILLQYQNSLQSVWSKTTKTMDIFVDTFQSHIGYEFTMLKELNQGDNVDAAMNNFEAKLKEILAQQNTNEKDMLIFFEADYSDQIVLDSKNNKSNTCLSYNNEINSQQQATTTKNIKENPSNSNDSRNHSTETKTNRNKKLDRKHQTTNNNDSLLDLELDVNNLSQQLDNYASDNPIQLNSLFSSSLIDFDQIKATSTNNTGDHNTCFIDKLLISDKQRPDHFPSNNSSTETKTETETANSAKDSSTLNTWLNLFADIDPLLNPDEFEKRFSADQINDRNC